MSSVGFSIDAKEVEEDDLWPSCILCRLKGSVDETEEEDRVRIGGLWRCWLLFLDCSARSNANEKFSLANIFSVESEAYPL